MSLKTANCLNCSEPTAGNFCTNCGQRNADYRVSLRELLGDALDGLFQIDSRIARTILPFLVRPGFLTGEYNAGRRMRYSSPLRIYLLLSVAYFFALSLVGIENPIDLGSGTSKTAGQVQGEGKLNITALDSPEVRLGSPRIDQHIAKQLKMLRQLGPQEATRRMKDAFLSQVSKALFVLLPLFALLLKLLYLRSRRFYIEHLTFALHLHAFVFLILLFCLLPLVREHLGWIVLFGYVHMLISLRTVYQQSWLRTACKSVVLLFFYTLFLLIALVGVAVLTLAFA